MRNVHFITTQALLGLFIQQATLQQQLLEAQQTIIELQKQVQALKPDTPADEDVFWHVSGKMTSVEAASSTDLATLQRFRKWNMNFAKKYLKPYLNPKVYSETLNQMLRGLAERIAELEAEQQMSRVKKALQGDNKPAKQQSQIIQLQFEAMQNTASAEPPASLEDTLEVKSK